MVKYRVGNIIIDSDEALSSDWECFAYDNKCSDGGEVAGCDGSGAQKIARKNAAENVCNNVIKLEHLQQLNRVSSCSGCTLDHPQFRTIQLEEGWIYEFKADNPCVMEVDKDYSQVKISDGAGQEYLLRLAVECRLIREGFISLHGACVISPNGEAIIFTGNSGVGKSTRAAAWKTALDLKMISGDRPLLDTKARVAYGVPWDGKEGIHVDLNAGISVIFNVIRADEDECQITKMGPFDALRVLLAQTFMPMWDTDLAAMAMGNLNQLINSGVRVANLVSSWDEAAARLAWAETQKM